MLDFTQKSDKAAYFNQIRNLGENDKEKASIVTLLTLPQKNGDSNQKQIWSYDALSIVQFPESSLADLKLSESYVAHLITYLIKTNKSQNSKRSPQYHCPRLNETNLIH